MSDENVTLDAAGVPPGSKLAAVVAGRADIMALTQATMEAVLAPKDPGGISAEERVVLACRIARLNDEQVLAEHFAGLMPEGAATELADPSFVPNGDVRVGALIRHVDLVTRSPRDATEQDIDALKKADISEADIVRLTEIIAFVNYQVRIIAGIRLLGEIT
jgi:uncharacterized protein YciW